MIFQVLFGAVALTVHETYEKVMNYTFPISVQSYGMMIPRPKELSRLYLFIAPFTVDVRILRFSLVPFVFIFHINNFFFYLSICAFHPRCDLRLSFTLTTQTWLCLLVTIALIGPLFYGVHYLSPYHEHHQITKRGGLFKVQNCFWYMYGALLQQGSLQISFNFDYIIPLKLIKIFSIYISTRWHVLAKIG